MSNANLHDRLQRYQRFLEEDPHNIALLQDAADMAYQLGDYAQAQDMIERILQLNAQAIAALMLKGVMAISLSRLDEAEALFDQISRLEGGVSPQLLYNQAYVLMLQQRYTDAVLLAKEAAAHLDVLPQAAELYVNALHFCGKVEEAIEFAETTLAQYPQLQVLHGLLATLYVDLEDWQKAQHHARQQLKSDPENSDALSVLGNLALAEQDAQEARQYFVRAVKNYPNNGRAWAGKAMAFMLQGDLAQAEEDLQEALTHMPSHVGTWHVLAWCQILQGHLAKAQQTLEHALQMERNFAETHGSLAVLAIMQGRLEEGQKEMTRALKLDPKCFSGLFAQTLLLQTQGNTAQAQALMAQLQQTPVLPDGTSIQQAVAKMLRK